MYRVLVGNLDKPFFVLQPEGKVKYLSEDFGERYGHDASHLVDENFFSLLNSEDLADFVTEYTQVIHTGKSRQGVGPYRLETTAGGSFVHLVNLIPVVNDAGDVTEVIGVVKDITEKVEDFGETIETSVVETVEPGEVVEEDVDPKHSELWYKSLIGVNFS
jgi:PAS domain S-box-containing protein